MVETERLLIRPCQLEDIPAYAKIVADPDVMRYIGPGLPLSSEDAKKSLTLNMAQYEKSGWSRFVVVEKNSGELTGFCGYADYNDELDFGWRYGVHFWGKGYATEAATAVLKLGIEKFKFPRIVCIAHVENTGSIRVIEKIGMDFEKEAMEEDSVIQSNGFKIYIDPQSAMLLKDISVDYVEGLQGAGFKIANPNAKTTCGCGNSFS